MPILIADYIHTFHNYMFHIICIKLFLLFFELSIKFIYLVYQILTTNINKIYHHFQFIVSSAFNNHISIIIYIYICICIFGKNDAVICINLFFCTLSYFISIINISINIMNRIIIIYFHFILNWCQILIRLLITVS